MKDYTEIVVVLDRSGSMQAAKNDHVGGLRSFVQDQKSLDGDVRFSLIQFDTNNPCEIIYDGTPINDVTEIDLIPRGGTPLLDAIGMATAHIEKRLSATKAKPHQVVVMTITDGGENASREWTKPKLKSRIEDLEKGVWKFLFLGAGIDAFGEAAGTGIGAGSTLNMAAQGIGTQNAYHATSQNLMSARKASLRGDSHSTVMDCLDYTPMQRTASMGGSPEGDLSGTLVSSSDSSPDKETSGRRRPRGNRGSTTAGSSG